MCSYMCIGKNGKDIFVGVVAFTYVCEATLQFLCMLPCSVIHQIRFNDDLVIHNKRGYATHTFPVCCNNELE